MVGFDELKKYSEIFVIGHKNPDADSIFSSIVLTNILIKNGINAKFAVLRDLYNYSYEDEKVINTYMKEKPIIINNEDTKNLNFILVDHNDPNQSIELGNIICSFDHHINLNKIKECYSEEFTSTLLYIYDIFRSTYEFSDYEKELIAISVICDSEYLASSRFSKKDRILYESLEQDIEVLEFRGNFFQATDLSKKIDEIFSENHKKYDFENKEINRVSIKTYKNNICKLEEYVEYLKKLERIWIVIWCEYDTNKTYVILKNEDKITKIIYNYIITSSVLLIKELYKNGKFE